MKKLLTVVIAIAMMLTMAITAFANPGSFVDSPSKNKAPELVEGTNKDAECDANIVVTAYGDRHLMSEDDRLDIEKAYNDVVNTTDLSTLNSALGELAKKLGVDAADFSVSDLFNVSITDCGSHNEHGAFNVTLKADTLDNFICLLRYVDGAWQVVEGAKMTDDGKNIKFEESEFGPFAIVVYTGEGEITPPADVPVALIAGIAIAVVSAAGIIFFIIWKKKKKKDDQEQ